MTKYEIYIDSFCQKNPGQGGWGLVVMDSDENKVCFIEYNREENTTKNRLELEALLCALGYAETNLKDLFLICSDNFNSWLQARSLNGEHNSKNQPAENLDLIKSLRRYSHKPSSNFEVCKCAEHSSIIGKEMANALARGCLEEALALWDLEYTFTD